MSPTELPITTAASVVGGAGIFSPAALSVAAETIFARVVVDEVATGVAATIAEVIVAEEDFVLVGGNAIDPVATRFVYETVSSIDS